MDPQPNEKKEVQIKNSGFDHMIFR